MTPFVTPLQELQFYDKYSRWNPELGRRETWDETCQRVIQFFESQLNKRKLTLADDVWADLFEGLHSLDALPSMRIIQMAGPALERCNVGAYNCAYLPIDGWQAFGELLYVLMQGTGVGFSVEVDYVDSLPRIKRQRDGKPKKYTIPDTTEGWCHALVLGLETWAAGEDVSFDFSRIRPQGAVLKTKGGRASGPDPLRQLLEFARAKLLAAQGRRLDPIDAHDIACFCGQIVQVGGVRRAAEISLSDLDDRDMRDAKAGQFWVNNVQRSMANNSAVYADRPKSAHFLEEWLALAKSGSGERGIFNRGGLTKQVPARRKKHKEFGVNPCYAAGTLVHTRYGHRRIEDLVGIPTEIWDGVGWRLVGNFRITAEDEAILSFELHDGSSLSVTPEHRLILHDGTSLAAKNATPGMSLMPSTAPESHGGITAQGAYLKGFLVGDGSCSQSGPLLSLYRPKYCCESRLLSSAAELPVEDIKATNLRADLAFEEDGPKRKAMKGLVARRSKLLPWVTDHKKGLPAEAFSWDLGSKTEFLAGLFDADGTASDTTNGWMYQLTSTSRQLLLDVQTLLKTIGVASKVAKAKNAGTKRFREHEKEYATQDCWRLTVSQAGSINLARRVAFSRLVSFADKKLTYRLRSKATKIVAIEQVGRGRVYCCTAPPRHQISLSIGIDCGQCGEIILRPRQFCNLSIAVARPGDTQESLTHKVRLATIWGTMQSLLTDFKYISPEWKANCEEERLLGVDITGQMDCASLQPHDGPHRQILLDTLKKVAVDTNKEFAEAFGIPQSAAVTCVKPSGNSAILFNSSSGLHPRYAKFYIRRMRIGAYTPVGKLLKDAGVPWHPEVGQTAETATVLVFDFPVAAPAGSPTRHDMTAVQQLDNWLDWKQYYTEHNPSVTIYVEDHEWPEVGAWVYRNFEHIGGLSFLPKDGGVYELAPYEEISEDQYAKAAKAMPVIDFARLADYETEDTTEVQREFQCTGDRCEV